MFIRNSRVDLIEVLEIMAQMWQFIILLRHKPSKVTSVFILNYLKNVIGRLISQKNKKQILKP
jgi:hypothetical protein